MLACCYRFATRVSVEDTHRRPVFYLKDTPTSLLFSPTILSGPGAILRCALPENMSAPAKCPPERGVRHVTTQVLRICTRRVSTRMLPCSGGVLVWRTHPPAFCSKDTPTSLLIEGHTHQPSDRRTHPKTFSLAPRPPSVPASRHEGLNSTGSLSFTFLAHERRSGSVEMVSASNQRHSGVVHR